MDWKVFIVINVIQNVIVCAPNQKLENKPK